MKLSLRGEYALRALLVLGLNYGGDVVRIQTMWRQAPISAAFVISAGMAHQSRSNGLLAGASRMGEVLFGCVVGIVVAWIVSVLWPLPDAAEASAKN